MKYEVFDNIAGQAVRSFEEEESANWLCRGLNLRDGPGGRYRVQPVRETEVTGNERKWLRLIKLITEYGGAKFGDEWWPGHAEPYLGADQAAELDRLLELESSLQAKTTADPTAADTSPRP